MNIHTISGSLDFQKNHNKIETKTVAEKGYQKRGTPDGAQTKRSAHTDTCAYQTTGWQLNLREASEASLTPA